MNGFISFLFYLNYCSSQTRFVHTLFTTTLYLTSAKQITKAAVHREQHKADYEKDVEKFVRAELMAKRPIFGFGHAVLRKEDPRATIQLKLAKELCPDDKNIKIGINILTRRQRINMLTGRLKILTGRPAGR